MNEIKVQRIRTNFRQDTKNSKTTKKSPSNFNTLIKACLTTLYTTKINFINFLL